MEYKKYECNSYNVYTIKTDMYKTCYAEVLYRNTLKPKDLTRRNFLCDILTFTSKNYPTQKDLFIEYEELYNAYADSGLNRVGNQVLTSYFINFLSPKYSEKKITEKSLKLLFDLISEPNIVDGEFDHDSFNIIKNNTKAAIDSYKDNPKSYAIKRMLEEMDKKSPMALKMVGNLDDLNDITPKNLVDTYNEFMTKDICDIYIIGDLDMDEVVKIIDKYFKNRVIKNTKPKLYLEQKPKAKVKVVKEKFTNEQACLVVGCTTNNLTEHEKHVVFRLYEIILGSGSLDTKLGRYLREDNSLCYYVSSMYLKYDNVLLINTGIDVENYSLAVKLIKKSLKEMKVGKITKKELESAKKYFISSLKIAEDSKLGLVSQYQFKNISNLPDVDTRIKEAKKVTVDDIIKVAKKVKLDTIYLLYGGNKNGRN